MTEPKIIKAVTDEEINRLIPFDDFNPKMVWDEVALRPFRTVANHFKREGAKEAVEWLLQNSDPGTGQDIKTLERKWVMVIDSEKLKELKKELGIK